MLGSVLEHTARQLHPKAPQLLLLRSHSRQPLSLLRTILVRSLQYGLLGRSELGKRTFEVPHSSQIQYYACGLCYKKEPPEQLPQPPAIQAEQFDLGEEDEVVRDQEAYQASELDDGAGFENQVLLGRDDVAKQSLQGFDFAEEPEDTSGVEQRRLEQLNRFHFPLSYRSQHLQREECYAKHPILAFNRRQDLEHRLRHQWSVCCLLDECKLRCDHVIIHRVRPGQFRFL
mmetsp:Transcript_2402/g.5678  ORF Transcript_2402/g.5678 Transcript_2402/m.5678 type:complete len:230 (+) Transcript_2402:549-1238(+)